MAGLTGKLGLTGQQRTMKAGSILQFPGHLDVTGQAAIRHAVTLNWPGVTGRAVTIDLRVGTHAVPGNISSSLAERTRTEEGAAPEDQEQGDHEQGNHGGRYTARRETTQSPSHSTYLNSVA
jgi:hypothetical protein